MRKVNHVRDLPKVEIFAAISSTQVYGPYFFTKTNVTGAVYLNILQLWLTPQLIGQNFQTDETLPYYLNDVCHFLSKEHLRRWINRGSNDDNPHFPWPPYSPDITPCAFFYKITSKFVCLCPTCHVIYKIYTKGSQTHSVPLIIKASVGRI